MCAEALKNGREEAVNPQEGREKARGTDHGVNELIPAKVNKVAPGSTLRFPACCAKPPVPKVAIHVLNGHCCFISSLLAVNSNPRLGPSSQDQSHKDVGPAQVFDMCEAEFVYSF